MVSGVRAAEQNIFFTVCRMRTGSADHHGWRPGSSARLSERHSVTRLTAVVGVASHSVVLVEAAVPGVHHGELNGAVVVAIDDGDGAEALGPNGAAVAFDVAVALVEHRHGLADEVKPGDAADRASSGSNTHRHAALARAQSPPHLAHATCPQRFPRVPLLPGGWCDGAAE